MAFFAANSRRLNLFERSVECGVEFCFFLVRGCLSDTGEIFARRIVFEIHTAKCVFLQKIVIDPIDKT